METGGSPSFPGDPITALPCSKAPGGPPRQTNCGASVLPSLFLARRLPHCFTFEAQSHGFTARCLRLKAPFLDTNQGSLPVDGQSLSGGVVPPGLGRGFRLLATSFSPFGLLFGFASALPASQGFGWRQGTLKSGRGFMGRAEPGDGWGTGVGRGGKWCCAGGIFRDLLRWIKPECEKSRHFSLLPGEIERFLMIDACFRILSFTQVDAAHADRSSLFSLVP